MNVFNKLVQIFSNKFLKNNKLKPRRLGDGTIQSIEQGECFIVQLRPAARKQIVSLLRRSEEKDLAALIRQTLATYDFLLEHREQGGEVVLRKPDGEEEVLKVGEY